MSPKTRLTLLRIFIIIGVVALTIFLISIRDQIKQLEGYGYPGIFLVSMLATSTVIVPLPGVLLTSMLGMAGFNPLLLAVCAGAGAALGEMTGYMVGFSGQGVVERSKFYDRVLKWMEKYGSITILVLAVIPNPAFDIVGMVAGVMKMPIPRFLLFCAAGEIIKYLIFALAGSGLATYIK
ncbi:MAG TPA: VTT domain-containing protein [Anaerolineaceae bacterium]|nr:VTT domain-containing protein [Anaerolineaceae bacterium]HPN52838.1 VTT domain-containing protein [Anaerolineaceae bacterium]